MTSLIHIFCHSVHRSIRHSVRRSLLSPIFASLSLLSCTAVLNTGCAGVPTKITNPVLTARSDQYLQKMDWQKAGDDAVQHLTDYLRVDTTNPSGNPSGNELRGAQHLAEILQKDGISSEILPFADGRANLVARINADPAHKSGEKPLCMLSHIDVVTAEAEKWPADKGPLSGVIDENQYIWGRGALDMKSLGVLEMETLLWIKRLGIPLHRDVILLAVGDEEVEGLGVQDLVKNHWDKLDCGHVVNEGGMGVKDAVIDGQTLFGVSVGEKGLLWLRMTAKGPPGHGSRPAPEQAPHKLLWALQRVQTAAQEISQPRIPDTLYKTLHNAGEESGGGMGMVLTNPWLIDLVVKGRLMDKSTTRAMITTTVNLTGFSGAFEPNVVPSEVYAQFDMRLLPGVTPDEIVAQFRQAINNDPAIEFTMLSQSLANVSVWEDDPFYQALTFHAAAVHSDGGKNRIVAGPVTSPGFTDCKFLRPLGARCYGMMPFVVTTEELETMHGHNERISVDNMHKGVKALLRAVVDVAAVPVK